VIGSLLPLDEEALVEILTKPKNALAKQYRKLLDIDGVELEFEQGALEAIAKKAIERKTGARGLRSIIEEIMLEIMFELPSRDDIKKCIITKDTVVNEKGVAILLNEDGEEVKVTKQTPKESA